MKKQVHLSVAFASMVFVVAISNYLVLWPINDWLTWGAFSYPVSFLITELTNRLYGPKLAKRVVYAGFITGLFLSSQMAPLQIAAASGAAFLISQLLDILVFNRLRQLTWWMAPFFASFSASIIDTAVFWSLAFYPYPSTILTWALGDLLVKFSVDVTMLLPFRIAIRRAFAK